MNKLRNFIFLLIWLFIANVVLKILLARLDPDSASAETWRSELERIGAEARRKAEEMSGEYLREVITLLTSKGDC